MGCMPLSTKKQSGKKIKNRPNRGDFFCNCTPSFSSHTKSWLVGGFNSIWKNMLVQMDPSSPNFGMEHSKKRKPPSSISWIKQMVQTLLDDEKPFWMIKKHKKKTFDRLPPPAPSAARTSHTGFPSDSSDPWASAPPPWHRPWPRPRRGVRRARRRPGVGDWRPGWRSRCP